MKKIILLLLPFIALAQNPTSFPYGVKISGGQPTVSNTGAITTTEAGGVQGRISYNSLLNGRTAQGDTGVLTFSGLATNSATAINVGAAVGFVVDNETNPLSPTYTPVNYAGATGVTVTTVGSGQASYVMLSSLGVISFQTSFPTSTERKEKIWLGKVSHPAGSVTLVINEPDYITSPMAFSRDLLQSLGGFVNNGVYPVENGANLNMNVTGGTIMGDGVNFVTNRSTPNLLSMGPNVVATFSERTRSGGVATGVTSMGVGFYDSNGDTTPDAIPGGGNTSTLHYVFAIPGQGYIVQYGQNTYSSLVNAIAAIGKETFVKWPNLQNNAILIGVLAAQKNATSLRTQDGQAQFFQADRLGGLIGSTAGVSTATLQSTYNNSPVPQITTSTALGALTIKRGSASDTDNILVGQNGVGTNTSSITGAGFFTCSKIGVRTSSPDSDLHVLGANDLSGTTRNLKAHIGGAAFWDTGSYEELGLGFSGIRSIAEGVSGNWSLAFATGSGTQFNAGTQSERMRVTGDGNVLIGTSTSNGNKLRVVGGDTELDRLSYTKGIPVVSIDFDNIINAGFYSGNNLTNSPEGNTGYFHITVEAIDNLYVHQTATMMGIANTQNRVFTRCKTGSGTWQPWEELRKTTYKVYTALLTQSGTSAPVATVLENTTGATITWSRSGVGSYTATASSSVLTASKTAVSMSKDFSNVFLLMGSRASSTTCEIRSATSTTATYSDGAMFESFVEIRVYN